MSSRSRFSPFLPGLFFAATCVFFVFAASCVYFEKNKDGGIFGENPKKCEKCARQAASIKNFRLRGGQSCGAGARSSWLGVGEAPKHFDQDMDIAR